MTESEKDLIMFGISLSYKSTGERIDPRYVRFSDCGLFYFLSKEWCDRRGVSDIRKGYVKDLVITREEGQVYPSF